ncbi:transposase family protein [Spirosoma sp. KCTC 42546]|uniref:ISAon1 family transposase N-terminal region protein n=1 Tax=Spirosoma sp. KCTC 42546 TaxID=2520506 RepID=UPI0011593B1A|nr:transposase family protein [Spirosoma sp. KCTC 42546]QDK77610.1 transposase family protein [Spirosoma sp. KCTC 42546]
MESFLPIIQFLLPEFILENFELTAIDRQEGVFQVHIEEKNADEQDPERKNLLSKGFFPTITVQDFPIRGHQVFLHIKRRRWLNTKTGKVVYRDWTQVAEGTRMTGEFAAFLKDISRYQPD